MWRDVIIGPDKYFIKKLFELFFLFALFPF